MLFIALLAAAAATAATAAIAQLPGFGKPGMLYAFGEILTDQAVKAAEFSLCIKELSDDIIFIQSSFSFFVMAEFVRRNLESLCLLLLHGVMNFYELFVLPYGSLVG